MKSVQIFTKKIGLQAAVLLSAFFFVACEKEEVPVKPATSQSITASMGNDYSQMLYFDIANGIFSKQLPHVGYDLQFENTPEGRYIFLNSSNFMMIKNLGVVNFESVTDTSSPQIWAYDFPTGENTRSAIGAWFNTDGTSKNEVFIIDRGVNELGESIGFVKMMVLQATADDYTLRFSNLDNSNNQTMVVQKEVEKYRTQIALPTASIEDIEPNSKDWHLHFTQYTDYSLTAEGDTQAYLVRGVLINPTNTEVAVIRNENFETINSDFAQLQTYSSHNNAIGYDWKVYNFGTAQYEIVPDLCYVIKEASGVYYKLRFTGFYDDQGNKGAAQFEVIGL